MQRIGGLKKYLKENKIQGFFVSSYENRRYFSGFTGSNGYLLITEEEQILITDQRYTEQGEQQAPGYTVVTHGLDPFKTIKKTLEGVGVESLGFESRHVTDFLLRNLKQNLPGIEWIPTVDVGKRMRAIKDEDEIVKLKRAVYLADEALKDVLPCIRPGVTEREVAIELEYRLARMGSEGPAFGTIVASGIRSSLPHGQPTGKVIEDGDMVVIDFAGRYEGYLSDITRTIWVGEPEKEMVKMYHLVEKALQAAKEGLRVGVTCGELDTLARDVFMEAGLEQYSLRGLGHGVGLEIHEYPRVVMDSEETIMSNMVFTIEPGLYVPEKGGVRLEDIVWVQETGYEVLTQAPLMMRV